MVRLFPRFKWSSHVIPFEQHYLPPVGIGFYGITRIENYQDKNPVTVLDLLQPRCSLAIAGNVEGIYSVGGLTAEIKEQEVVVCVLLGLYEKPSDTLLNNVAAVKDLFYSKWVNPRDTYNLNWVPPYLSFNQEYLNYLNDNTFLFTPVGSPNVIVTPIPAREPIHIFDLQTQLAYWEYYKGKLDGEYGPITQQAVRFLQKDLRHGNYYLYEITGEYDEQTRQAWERYTRSLE